MAAKKFKKDDQLGTFTLSELEQVRVVADPLRLRILEVFCDEERTTKQVAEQIGEKPTKLYHHVDALEKVGLIKQTRTKRNRGTLERYYLAIARRFAADPSLFDPEVTEDSSEAMRSVIQTVFGETMRELSQLAESKAPQESGILSYCYVHADQKTIDRLDRRIKKLVKDLQELDDPDAELDEGRKYRFTLAFYPLDKMDDK